MDARVSDGTNPVRVGVVGASVTAGASDWAAVAHVPALRTQRGLELTAVCTSRQETAQASADKFGARLAFHDVTRMAEHPDIDLVSIALRVPRHRDAVLAAAGAGAAIYCEWPMAADLVEAELLSAAAAGVRGYVGFQMRADPAVAAAALSLRVGEIGAVLSASVTLTSRLQVHCRPEREWMAQRHAGANPFTIHAGHLLDLVTVLLGDVRQVRARLSTRVTTWIAESGRPLPVDAPDTCHLLAVVGKGAEVKFSVRAVPDGVAEWSIVVHGTTGSLRLGCAGAPSIGPNKLTITHQGRTRELTPEAPANSEGVVDGPGANVARTYAHIARLWNASEADRPGIEQLAPATFSDGLHIHRLLDAVERSSDTGSAIRIPPRTEPDSDTRRDGDG